MRAFYRYLPVIFEMPLVKGILYLQFTLYDLRFTLPNHYLCAFKNE